MLKLRMAAIITTLLGIVSLAWIIYDYILIAAYSTQENPFGDWKMVSLGFVPIILFHFSFFITMYILFDFLKNHKTVLKENLRLKNENEQIKLNSTQEDLHKQNWNKNKKLDQSTDPDNDGYFDHPNPS